MASKKGMDMNPLTLVASLILVLLLLGVIIFGVINGTFSQIFRNVKSQVTPATLQSCRAQGERLQNSGIEFKSGSDGFPYSCAPCVGGDNSKDDDLDGMPNDCDITPQNADTNWCKHSRNAKGGWLPSGKDYEGKSGQCCMKTGDCGGVACPKWCAQATTT